ncbi:MAG: putative ABC exporter domain-containing protein [Elusimicrobiota bacterium]
MNNIVASLRIYLDLWSKELKHDLKKLYDNKIKFFITLILAAFFMGLIFTGFYRILTYVKDTPIVGMALASRLIGTIFLALFILLVYSAVVSSFSVLYFSEDNNFLFVSPFNQGGIIIGKLIKNTVYASWMSLVVIVPLFVVLAILFNLTLPGWFITIISVILYFFSAASLAMLFTVSVVKIFPARKIKDFMIVGLVILATGFYVLVRMLDLEQILRPGRGSLAAEYLASFELPRAVFLPPHWVSKIVVNFMNERSGWIVPFFIVLGFAVLFFMVYYFVSKKYFYSSWEKVQSEEKRRYKNKKFGTSPLLAKDVRTFFRDTRQWTQLLLVLALVVIYLFNIYKLPLDIPHVHYLIGFLNIGMIGFVIASVGLRFTYSSISLEGKYFWIIMSSPYSVKNILKKKYIENIIPVLTMSMTLVIISNYILDVSGFLNILSGITVFALTWGITSLGMGMAAIYPKFNASNPAEIEASWGGLMYMIYSFFYIGLTLSLEAVWVRMYFLNQVRGEEIYYPVVWIVVALLIILNIFVNIIPLKIGLNKLGSLELET